MSASQEKAWRRDVSMSFENMALEGETYAFKGKLKETIHLKLQTGRSLRTIGALRRVVTNPGGTLMLSISERPSGKYEYAEVYGVDRIYPPRDDRSNIRWYCQGYSVAGEGMPLVKGVDSKRKMFRVREIYLSEISEKGNWPTYFGWVTMNTNELIKAEEDGEIRAPEEGKLPRKLAEKAYNQFYRLLKRRNKLLKVI